MSDIFGNSPSTDLTDAIITDSTTKGTFTITTLNNEQYNLQTPDNGNSGNVLQIDGLGNTFWGTGSTGGSGIVYNGSTPIPSGQHITINTIGTEVFKSKLNESATNLDVDGLNITNANDIYANQIRNISGNTLYFNTDNNITILNNQPILTLKTLFTQDQELITKKYVDDAIDDIPPSNPFNQILNTNNNVIFNSVSSFGEYDGILKFSSLYPKNSNDLNIGTQNTDILRLGGEGVFLDNAILAGLNDVNSTRISADLLYPKTLTTSYIDLSVDENIKVNTSNFLLNDIQIATINDLPIPQTFQDVYNTSPNPAQTILSTGKNINFTNGNNDGIFQINEDNKVYAPNLKTDNIKSTNPTSTSSIDFGTLNKIILSSTDEIAVDTSNFLLNGIQIATINDIPPTINPTLQQVYNNSPNPALTILDDLKNIRYIDEDGSELVMEIDGNFGAVRIPNIEIDRIKKNNPSLGNIIVEGTGLIANNFTKQGGLATEYLMANGSLTNTDNLNSVIEKTQYIDVPLPNYMAINATTFAVKSLFSSADLVSFNLLPNVSTVNITPPIATSSISLTSPITANNQATTKSYVDTKIGTINVSSVGSGTALVSGSNPTFQVKSLSPGTGITLNTTGPDIAIINSSPASAIVITSTDTNLLTINATNPTFSITPKYSWFMNFGGNNTITASAQWMVPGGIRTATMNGTNTAPFQSISPISSVITFVNITRTTTTGTCSLAYAINNGTAVVITSLAIGVASNASPIATNISVPAGATLAMSVLSTGITSGNCLASLILRGA